MLRAHEFVLTTEEFASDRRSQRLKRKTKFDRIPVISEPLALRLPLCRHMTWNQAITRGSGKVARVPAGAPLDGMATRLHLPRHEVWPTANADPVRTLAIVIPPVTRVRTLVVVPAAEATKLLRPVPTADDLRRALGVVLGHEPMIPLIAGLSP